jgi:hypothetical protein
MKVHIGKYPSARSKKERKIKVEIHDHDVWSFDNTLAHIVHPALVRLREIKHGAPNTDDQDAPEHLRSTAAAPKENDWDTDALHFKRWDWILDEMIWAFGQEIADPNWENQFHHGKFDDEFIDNDDGTVTWRQKSGSTYRFDREGWQAHHARMQNGFRLFGKYYSSLWD